MKKKELHIISHTHWDREWYLTFQQFRSRLVDLIDHLLGIMEKDPRYKYFTLDGQTVVLEDYLEIRPENRERLSRLIKEKRIFIGPWYVLPDEFLVSGEAIVRNLLLGHRIASQFGGVMKVGYIPDTFGHISQLPQILLGFDIDNVILWRGVASERSECVWLGANGSPIYMFHLGKEGYCNARHLPSEIDKAYKRIEEIKEACEKRTDVPYLLLLNGCDHLEPQKELPDIIKGVNSKLKRAVAVHSNLPLYIQKVRKANPRYLLLKGEFRDGLSHAYLLTGVISARMYLKQRNHTVQNLLERWAEPFSSILHLLGGEDYFSLVWRGWKYLLQNHPHDSICGCSIDEVHRQMLTRFSSAEEIGKDVTERSIERIAGFIKNRSLKDREAGLIMFNPLGWERDDLVDTEVSFEVGSKYRYFRIYDHSGREVPYQIVKGWPRDIKMILRTDDFPLRIPVGKTRICLKAKMPSFGYSLYRISPCEEEVVYPGSLVHTSGTLENEFLKVKIEPNGTLSILDKDTGKAYRGCNLFEDGGDCGDEYNYSYPVKDGIFTTSSEKPEIDLIENGPLRATYSIEYKRWQIPEGLSSDRKKRSNKKIKLRIQSLVTLTKGIKRVDIETVVYNTARDHRLRVLFPSGIMARFSWAEGQFDIVKRSIKTRCRRKVDLEEPLPTHPQQAFVDVNDGKKGLAIANQGLPEYEVKDDRHRTVALTLLRCVGYLSRHDLLTRANNAGPPIPAEEAQCIGRHSFRYAIIPHRGDWLRAGVFREAHNFITPLKAYQFDREKIGKRGGYLSRTCSFVRVEPYEVVISSIKRFEGGKGIIIRLFNTGKKIVDGRLHFFRKINEAYYVNLAEEKKGRVRQRSSRIVEFCISSKGIATILIT